MKFNLKRIRKAIFTKPYSLYFVLFFILFIVLNAFINQIHVTRHVLFDNLVYGTSFILFNLLIAGLIALNINLVIIKFKEYKQLNRKEGGLASVGLFIAFLGGACPGCFVGLFPAVLGLFGITASLSVLPLYGVELQIASALLLVVSAYYLSKNPVCKIEIKDDK